MSVETTLDLVRRSADGIKEGRFISHERPLVLGVRFGNSDESVDLAAPPIGLDVWREDNSLLRWFAHLSTWVVVRPNGSRLSCGALKKDSFPNLRAPPASSAC